MVQRLFVSRKEVAAECGLKPNSFWIWFGYLKRWCRLLRDHGPLAWRWAIADAKTRDDVESAALLKRWLRGES